MRKLREIFLKAALIAAAVITGGILLFLIGIILKHGLPQLSWSFLTTATSYLAGTTGILPNICNTLYLILIAMGAALPLGVGAAVYDFLAALPKNVIAALRLTQVLDWIKEVLPFAKLGLGWVCPALIGLVIGLIVHFCKPRATRTAC